MTKERFSRNAAVTSQAIIIAWAAVQLLASVFQKTLLSYVYRYVDADNRPNSWAAIVLCVGSLCILAANVMICRKKGKNAPFIIAAVSAGLLPIAVRVVNTFQLTSAVEEYQALSVYSNYILQPISYLLYVGAAVTIAAAAVYAFGSSETFCRKTAIASMSVLVVWTALQLLSSIFQRSILMQFTGLRENELDDIGKITSHSAVVLCFGALFILAANFMICQKRGRLVPLHIVSITTGLLPIISNRVDMFQRSMASFDSVNASYAVGVYNGLVGALSYLLYVGAVLSAAAAAVYIFAEGRDTEGNNIFAEIEEENSF